MRARLAAMMMVILATPAFAEDRRRSSYADMSPQTRAMQDDDTANPAMLWVLEGEALWRKAEGAAGRACADCHGAGTQGMRGVAARYPVFETRTNGPMTLEKRVAYCRTTHQAALPFGHESQEMLALTAYIARQSRGMAVAEPDSRLYPVIEAGRALFHMRQGQLNLSCASCHDDNPGQKLAGNVIPQGHPTAYPIYRLEWQALGSLQRRLRNCLSGMRAASYPYAAPELEALETYLIWRARGMRLEGPGVRP